MEPSSQQDDFSILSDDEDLDELRRRPAPIHHITPAGQVDPRAVAASELLKIRQEISKLNTKPSNRKLAVSYDETNGILSINQSVIHIRPNSNQGLLCSVLLRSKSSMQKSWNPQFIASKLDRVNPDHYSPSSFLEAARHINSKVEKHGLPILIFRKENSLKINKNYL